MWFRPDSVEREVHSQEEFDTLGKDSFLNFTTNYISHKHIEGGRWLQRRIINFRISVQLWY